MSHGPLRLSVALGVAVVTIDHPPTNLVDGPFIMGLISLLDELEAGARTWRCSAGGGTRTSS